MPRLITTSIPYMNGAPHMGHAMEMAITDALARYYRAAGQDVFFLTGSDEHGSKIFNKAKELGEDVRAMLDRNVAVFTSMNGALGATPDAFIRTTDQAKHWPGALALWKALEAKGDLYKKPYAGDYCEGCEAFKTAADLDEKGNCQVHGKPTVRIQEENWFFRLSKYGAAIKELIESKKLEIVPEFRANEVLTFIREGLEDVSFSRGKDKMPWGIPVPGDDTQVMYVWCDALTNYLTGAGFGADGKVPAAWAPVESGTLAVGTPFARADVAHVIGKDISRFHALIWIGMLLSAGLPIPSSILVHGFVNDANGQKMSKSLGNVVDPFDPIAEFGGDAVRFFLATEAGPGYDINYSAERLKGVFNDQLANNAGNFASRTCAMFAKNFPEGAQVPEGFVPDGGFGATIAQAQADYAAAMCGFDIRAAVQSVFALLDKANAYLNQVEPWKVKDDPVRLAAILLTCMEVNYHVTQMLSPVLPHFAEKMKPALGFTEFKIDPAFGFVASYAGKVLKISKPEIVFQRKA